MGMRGAIIVIAVLIVLLLPWLLQTGPVEVARGCLQVRRAAAACRHRLEGAEKAGRVQIAYAQPVLCSAVVRYGAQSDEQPPWGAQG